jgi:hypothetical protein
MSFDNTYSKRKDWRNSYLHSQRFDRSCRPHGGCGYCRDNRLYSYKKRKLKAQTSLEEADLKLLRELPNEFDNTEWTW